MQWLRQSIRNWLNRDEVVLESSSHPHNPIHQDSLFNVNFYNANGGNILEIRRYDSKKDENHYSLYVIPDGDDFSSRCAEIISLEIIKS